VIVLDTTVLAYAVGGNHRLAPPCRRLIEAITAGIVSATTTVEVIQEFVSVRARRRSRQDAVRIGRDYAALLAPLLTVDERDLERGLVLFGRHEALGSFDAVLVAAAFRHEAEALVSADRAFGDVRGLRHIDPATPALEALLS
jgi:uncharacterized protein